jgi:Saxitoxin biosynthesis operon protein SxtJ
MSSQQVAPDRRTLRQFAGLCLTIFGLLGLMGLLRGSGWSAVWLTMSLTLGIPGLLRPEFLRPVFQTWMWLTRPVSWLVSRLMLIMVFFCIVTPIGLILRLFGHDPLKLRDSQANTWWTPRKPVTDLRRYFRQY